MSIAWTEIYKFQRWNRRPFPQSVATVLTAFNNNKIWKKTKTKFVSINGSKSILLTYWEGLGIKQLMRINSNKSFSVLNLIMAKNLISKIVAAIIIVMLLALVLRDEIINKKEIEESYLKASFIRIYLLIKWNDQFLKKTKMKKNIMMKLRNRREISHRLMKWEWILIKNKERFIKIHSLWTNQKVHSFSFCRI